MHGMLETISTLSQFNQPAVYRTLAHLLSGHLPATSERWRKYTVGWSVGLGLIAALVVALMVIPLTYQSLPWYEVFNAIPSAMLVILILSATCAAPVGLVIKHLRNQEAIKVIAAAADAIIRIKDPRYVRMLLNVATGRYPFWSKYGASRALVALLPLPGIAKRGKLSASEEHKLASLLGANRGELILAVVRSLEFVGTGQSINALERFIRHRPGDRDNDDTVTAQTEAERVLPILQERRRQEQAASTLLRSSQVDEDTGERLLRPASDYACEEAQVDELLRPG
jgi:hypothetical protein